MNTSAVTNRGRASIARALISDETFIMKYHSRTPAIFRVFFFAMAGAANVRHSSHQTDAVGQGTY
jgi:hypothetical protein